MNRHPWRKKCRPLKATVEPRPPNPGRAGGGIGWEYVYPEAPPCRQEIPEPCDVAERYITVPEMPGDEAGR